MSGEVEERLSLSPHNVVFLEKGNLSLERDSLEKRLWDWEPLERGLLVEEEPSPGSPATRLGGGDPLEATRLWVGEGVLCDAMGLWAGGGVLREATRLWAGGGVRRGDDDLLEVDRLCEDGRWGEEDLLGKSNSRRWDSLERGLLLWAGASLEATRCS